MGICKGFLQTNNNDNKNRDKQPNRKMDERNKQAVS